MADEIRVTESENKNLVGSTFLDFLFVIVKNRKFLLSFIFVITLGSIIYALLAPKWYKSTASVFPAEQSDLLSSLGGLSSLVKNFSPAKGLAGLTGISESDKYIAILQSGTVTDMVIKKYDLIKVYDREGDFYEKVVKDLQGNVEFEIQDEGNLTLTVYDKDPQRAADMANYYVELLNETNSKLQSMNARANREFVEKRYFKNLEDIAAGEDTLKEFQERYGVIAVPEQLQTTVMAMSSIYGQLAQKEIEYAVLTKTLSGDHPIVVAAELEMNELKRKIDKMNTGGNLEDDVNLIIPFKQAPQLAHEYVKIYRDLEIQYKILEFITPIYEQSKVEEQRSTPSVIILDKAGPSERKAKPEGTLYGLVALVLSTLLGLFIVFVKEMISKMKENPSQQFIYISESLRNDLSRLRIKRK